ncbi:transcriptional regulator [Pasteurellaceae bacterium TAE3-ERU1]|nr:transcriptional regulator [Pasteurellaceae bacterium TAE3-ERU1]
MSEKKLTAVELKRQAMLASRLAYQKAKAEGKLPNR